MNTAPPSTYTNEASPECFRSRDKQYFAEQEYEVTQPRPVTPTVLLSLMTVTLSPSSIRKAIVRLNPTGTVLNALDSPE